MQAANIRFTKTSGVVFVGKWKWLWLGGMLTLRVWITRMGRRVWTLELFIALPREQGLQTGNISSVLVLQRAPSNSLPFLLKESPSSAFNTVGGKLAFSRKGLASWISAQIKTL